METFARSPVDVLLHHIQSLDAKDVDQLLTDYTEDSVLITPEATFRGIHQLRGFMEALLANFQGLRLQLMKQEAVDDMVYITWQGDSVTSDIPFATDTFVIRNGKIAYQTFGGYFKPKVKASIFRS